MAPQPPARSARLSEGAPRIAVVRASRIGDVVCALPALRQLKTALPSCELHLIVLPLLVDLVGRAPYVDRVHAFPGFPGIADQLFSPATTLAFFAGMQAERYDLAVQMHGTGTYANPFTLMLGARHNVGFISRGAYSCLLDAALPMPEHLSEVDRCLALVTFLLESRKSEPEPHDSALLRLLPQDHEAARAFLDGRPKPWIGLHIGARDACRRWPQSQFFQAAEELLGLTGGTVFLLGADDDPAPPGPLGDAPAHARSRSGLHDLRDRLSLPQTAALLSRLDCFIGNDSGPAHLAYAMGTPSLTLFRRTEPGRWGPRSWPGADDGRHLVLFERGEAGSGETGDAKVQSRREEGIPVKSVVRAALLLLDRFQPNRPEDRVRSTHKKRARHCWRALK